MYRLWAFDKNATHVKQPNGKTVADPIVQFGNKVLPDTLEIVLAVDSVSDLAKQAKQLLQDRQSLNPSSVASSKGYKLIVISGHGQPGEQGCGSGQGADRGRDISCATLPIHDKSLHDLSGLMEKGGILFLSGCNVGEGDQGGELLQKLSTTYFPQIDCMAYTKKTENGISLGTYANKVSVKAEGAASEIAPNSMRLFKGGTEVYYDSDTYHLGSYGQDLHERLSFTIHGRQ